MLNERDRDARKKECLIEFVVDSSKRDLLVSLAEVPLHQGLLVFIELVLLKRKVRSVLASDLLFDLEVRVVSHDGVEAGALLGLFPDDTPPRQGPNDVEAVKVLGVSRTVDR